jgi:hypothetical protein
VSRSARHSCDNYPRVNMSLVRSHDLPCTRAYVRWVQYWISLWISVTIMIDLNFSSNETNVTINRLTNRIQVDFMTCFLDLVRLRQTNINISWRSVANLVQWMIDRINCYSMWTFHCLYFHAFWIDIDTLWMLIDVNLS